MVQVLSHISHGGWGVHKERQEQERATCPMAHPTASLHHEGLDFLESFQLMCHYLQEYLLF